MIDDLDLSFRFLLAGLPIGLLWDPPVREAAVLGLRALGQGRIAAVLGLLAPAALGSAAPKLQRHLLGALMTRTPPTL